MNFFFCRSIVEDAEMEKKKEEEDEDEEEAAQDLGHRCPKFPPVG